MDTRRIRSRVVLVMPAHRPVYAAARRAICHEGPDPETGKGVPMGATFARSNQASRRGAAT